MKVQFFCAMDGSVMRWRSIEWRRCTYMKMLCQWLGPWPRTDLCQAAARGGSCGRGLCGLFLRPQEEEAVLLGQLAKELSHTLGFSKEKDFHLQSMPLVALTDPSNPFGSKQMLSWVTLSEMVDRNWGGRLLFPRVTDPASISAGISW